MEEQRFCLDPAQMSYTNREREKRNGSHDTYSTVLPSIHSPQSHVVKTIMHHSIQHALNSTVLCCAELLAILAVLRAIRVADGTGIEQVGKERFHPSVQLHPGAVAR